jgi:hypothetical protein
MLAFFDLECVPTEIMLILWDTSMLFCELYLLYITISDGFALRLLLDLI